MSILPISHRNCLCEPFTDYLNLTAPREHIEEVTEAVRPFADVLGCSEVTQGLFQMPQKAGTLKISVRGQVAIFSASGGVLERLRAIGAYNDYLSAFLPFPMRISMMHATVDYRLDAPDYLEAIYQLGVSGNCYLTRKAIQPHHVSRLQGQNSEGAQTGTVYLGIRRNADVWAKAYDKRQERIAKGFADPGNTLRLEIAVQSDVNASLRDASKPHDIFYHFASRSLVEAPPSFISWEPHGTGLDLPPRNDNLTTHQRLWGILGNSLDLQRAINLAVADYGVDAERELIQLLRKRFRLSERAQVPQFS